MTTSEPQADRRDDDPREHRSIGQRIRDAVLGDPEDDRRDAPADAGYAERREDAYTDTRTGGDAAPADLGAPHGGASGAPGYTESGPSADRGAGGYVAVDTDAGHADTDRGPVDRADTDRPDTDSTHVDRGYADRVGTDRADSDGGYAGSADTDRGGAGSGYGDRTDTHTDTDRGYAGSADTDRGLTGSTDTGRGGAESGYADRTDTDRGLAASTDTDRGYAGSADTDRGGAESGYGDRADTNRADTDRGFAAGADTGRRQAGDAGTDEYAPYEQAMREHVQGGAVPDPVRDDVTQEGVARGTHDRAGYADRDVPAAPATGQAGGGYDDDRSGRADTAYADAPAGSAASGDRDLVTSSYDPDRDSGYDPQAAGTAMAGSGAAGATAVGQQDDARGAYDTRDYDPATDTGYRGEDRVDADRATAPRDADYDTGRVDTGDRDTGHAAGLGAAGAVAAGAAGAAAAHHRHDERSDTRFDEVDDTTTVEPTSTGRATPDTAGAVGSTTGDAAADRRAEAVADEADESDGGGRERLVPAERAHEYSSRWDALKGDFVDEPRRAVAQADDLVGELLDEIQRLFADQRRDLEQGFDHDRASTEDLRLALRRYRSFFDRLLSF